MRLVRDSIVSMALAGKAIPETGAEATHEAAASGGGRAASIDWATARLISRRSTDLAAELPVFRDLSRR